MGDVVAWLISFFLVIAIILIILYQLMCLVDLEYHHTYQYDSASRINNAVLLEFVAQGVLLVYGFAVSSIITQGRHFVDVTETFNRFYRDKKVRLYKLGYLVILVALSIFWMI